MTRRIILGQLPNGRQGLRVSKPGKDVTTAGAADLLLDTDTRMVQVVQSGRFTGIVQNQAVTVNGPSLGYTPFVLAVSNRWRVDIEYLSATRFRFTARTGGVGGSNNDIIYFIFNLPREP